MSDYKLVIKSPSDQIPNLDLDCDINWNVNDLKVKIQEENPAHPELSSQRLIFSGRLLKDEELLSTLYSKLETKTITIHLVCRSLSTVKAASPSGPIKDLDASEVESYQREYYNYVQQFYLENLNQRTNAGVVQTNSPPIVGNFQMSPYHYYGYQGYYPTNQVATDQSLNQPAAAAANDDPQHQQHQAIIAAGVGGGDAAAVGGDFLGGGGGAQGEGDIDVVDRFYMAFRLCLFIAVCAAYSSASKALLVLIVMAGVYLCNLYRRYAAAAPTPAAAAAVPNGDHQPPPAGGVQDASQPQSENANSGQVPSEPSPSDQPSTQEEPHAAPVLETDSLTTRLATSLRTVVSVSFGFVSTFFTSLIPENPPPIRLD